MIEFEERRADEEVGEIRDLERDGIPISLLPIYESIYIYIFLSFSDKPPRITPRPYHLTSLKNLPLARRFPSLETERRDKFQSSGRVLARTPRLATKTRTRPLH